MAAGSKSKGSKAVSDATPTTVESPKWNLSTDAARTFISGNPGGEEYKRLTNYLTESLQMPNLIILSGCGTSIEAGGPSMWDLWNLCLGKNKDESGEYRLGRSKKDQRLFNLAVNAGIKVHYCTSEEDKKPFDLSHVKWSGENIEEFLSRVDAYLQFNKDEEIQDYRDAAKTIILDRCRDIRSSADNLAHVAFLQRITLRQPNLPRPKIFTTNYDTCFERAAGLTAHAVIDGFSFTFPRVFDPRFFDYDIIEKGEYEKRAIQAKAIKLYKIHGSVNWKRTLIADESSGDLNEDIISIDEAANADDVCMIFPSQHKYQQSYIQPHLELMAQYLRTLRQPETCLMVIGFGLNDDHLVAPLLSAIKTNAHMRTIFVTKGLKDVYDTMRPDAIAAGKSASGVSKYSKYWTKMIELQNEGYDVTFISAEFGQFANKLLPGSPRQNATEDLIEKLKALMEISELKVGGAEDGNES